RSRYCRLSDYFLVRRRHSRYPLFPYTTLFRSQGERAAVVRHLLDCKNVWGYCRLPIDEWVDIIQRGGNPNFQGSEADIDPFVDRSEEHTSELQSLRHLVCRLLLEKKKQNMNTY